MNSDAVAVRSNYEKVAYAESSIDVYALMKNNSLKLEGTLWYQAWQGFLFLKQLPYRSDNLAAEIKRIVFRDILNGKEVTTETGTAYQTPDGKIFFQFY